MTRKKICSALVLLLLFASISVAQQPVNYSPAYFGPNALPVPRFSDATIPVETIVEMSGSHFWGFGDVTTSFALGVEIPLLPELVSFKVWYTGFETWRVTQEIYNLRNMKGGRLRGTAWGEFYVQTRMLLLRERRRTPSIILNSTLKTAAGTNFEQRRHFDTPGYYFSVEIGNSFFPRFRFLDEIRTVVHLGFLCWETTNSTQNDAPLYGGKIILRNRLFDFENTLSGYHGWMGNGDAPLVYSTRLTFKQPGFNLFIQYQYGIFDFPYHHIQAGISIRLPGLTPRYI
jgi:hypothetical protein